MSGYWIVERALESGGSTLVGLTSLGPCYTSKGQEMRFADRTSADKFKNWADGPLDMIVGQVGPLYLRAVGGTNA